MHVLEYLHRNVKTVAMPTAMVVGALLCRPVTALEGWTHQMITPSLIFLMLFVTFCRVKPRQMKPSILHFWLLLFQVVVSVAVYFLLLPLNPVVAQGAMICVLAPVAMAAVVIAGMLGANVPTMATYSLVCNMVIALAGTRRPVVCRDGGVLLHADTGTYRAAADHALRGCAVLPFRAARGGEMDRRTTARFRSTCGSCRWWSIIGRTTAFILDLHDASPATELWLAIRGAGDLPGAVQGGAHAWDAATATPAAGGQSLGQKNTVLAVWMSQSFLDPISSIAPTAYIVWQNFVNSYQIYRHDRREEQA